MGLITSRLDLDRLPASRRRSQQDETLYSYSLKKNYFSNYFFIGGERFEVDDPNYLFGDNCDLNFLSCVKPYSLPYKKAQQNLLSNINSKQQAINESSSRSDRLSSPFDILTGRHRQTSQSRKQDAQTQTLQGLKRLPNGPEPSQPLVMLVNIRKETLRLVNTAKFSTITTTDCDQNSLTNNSAASSTKSGYTSVKDVLPSDSVSFDNDDEEYQDALNETTQLSIKEDDDDDGHDNGNPADDGDRESKKSQQEQQQQLLETQSTKDISDIKITIDPSDGEEYIDSPSLALRGAKKQMDRNNQQSNRVYNIEFSFDCEVDCSIRIYYFCTREITPNGVNYKSQHATYKSKTYTFTKGLNQKFDQQEHTFQPHLFDEDLLIYKPLDVDGNYNSGAVFPIVIHCVALEGSLPRQSYSLVATVEKSQLDDSYTIKPLKQLIFVDGIQYILQDIYGFKTKRVPSPAVNSKSTAGNTTNREDSNKSSSSSSKRMGRNFRASTGSLRSNYSIRSSLDCADNSSLNSYNTSVGGVQYKVSVMGYEYKSLGGENSFECVICMSEERDTMLLPCRHLCLCNSCAQSLRYQANSCPICRCPFKAALSLRLLEQHNRKRNGRS